MQLEHFLLGLFDQHFEMSYFTLCVIMKVVAAIGFLKWDLYLFHMELCPLIYFTFLLNFEGEFEFIPVL